MRSPVPRIEISRVLNRSLVYASLTGGVLITYAASVILLRVLFPGDGPYAVALLSTGAAALVALPLRDRLQRAANRLIYGDRDEPLRAIVRLGEHLEASLETDEVLPTVVATVADALRLPYVAVELHDGAGPSIAAEHGRRPAGSGDDLLRLPLVHQGDPIGSLILARRTPRDAFSEADLALLADLGRQAGSAAHAVRLTTDLRRSREHLVTAREEERRRLQRDLHDGVGPTLAGTLMKMEAARSRLAAHPEDAERMLAELASDTRRIIEEVRRVTYDLRPPVLDQLGLVGALREQAASFVGSPERPLRIDVEAPGELPELSAAVEVAAYRIGVEGLTNVARHSGAGGAVLRLGGDAGTLVVEVEDDGCGIAGSDHRGVGHRSMRERAEELGGSVEVGAGRAGGTRIRARLPIRPDA